MIGEKETVKEWMERLAVTNECDDEDERMMLVVLRKLGFPNARVVYGIVYLEGKGTLDAPPADIHTTARMILATAEKQEVEDHSGDTRWM